MANAGKAIYARLSADNAVAALVDTRIFPHSAPENNNGVFPVIVYQTQVIDPIQTYGGPSQLEKHSVSIACIAETLAGATALSTAVLAALDGESGTWGTVRVQAAVCEGKTETMEVLDSTDTRYWVIELEFIFFIGE